MREKGGDKERKPSQGERRRCMHEGSVTCSLAG